MYHLCNSLLVIESGPSLTIGAGLVENRRWNTIFRLDIPVGNFGLPCQDVTFAWKPNGFFTAFFSFL